MNPHPPPLPGVPAGGAAGSSQCNASDLNPWRAPSAYLALACAMVGFGFLPVPFIGGAGLLVAILGVGLGFRFQNRAMSGQAQAKAERRLTILRIAAFVGAAVIFCLGFVAVLTKSSAIQAASRGQQKDVSLALVGLVFFSVIVSTMLGLLASWARRLDGPETIPLMLYWACYVPLAILLVSSMWSGATFRN